MTNKIKCWSATYFATSLLGSWNWDFQANKETLAVNWIKCEQSFQFPVFLFFYTKNSSLLICVPCVLKTCVRANVLCIFTCSRTNVPFLRTHSRANLLCMLTYSRANVSCVFMCLCGNVPCMLKCSRVNVPCVLTCSRVIVLYMLTHQRALRGYLPHVSICLACLCTHVTTLLTSSNANMLTWLESFASYGLHDYVITSQHALPPQ